MMKRFVKNEAVGQAVRAFKELNRKAFEYYNAELSEQERVALNFVKRAFDLESSEHLALALDTNQPVIELDRLLLKLGSIQDRTLFFRLLVQHGVDLNQLKELDGHRSIVRQPLAFPVGLYSAINHELFQLAIEAGLDLDYTTSLQRSDRFLETHVINMLDLYLLLDLEDEMDVRSLEFFTDHPATIGFVEQLKRSNPSSIQTIVETKKYQVDFKYAKHYPLFYAMIGRHTEVFEQLLEAVLKTEKEQLLLEDALLAFHNHQPGQASALGNDYIDSLYQMGEQLRIRANIDFKQVEDAYVLAEYQEIVERLRKDSLE